MGGLITVLVLVILVPLLAWMGYRRSRWIAEDAENLMRNIRSTLGGHPDDIKGRHAPHVYAKWIAEDAENLMRNILGGHPGDIEERHAPRVYAKVDDRLYSSLIRHFARLNAAEKSLRVVAESAVPMSSDAIVDAVNAMQKAEGKNSIPQPSMKLVLDGLWGGGLFVVRDGLHEVSTEGKLLNDLLRS